MSKSVISRILRLVGVAVVLAGLGGGGWWLYSSRQGPDPVNKKLPASTARKKAQQHQEPVGYVGAVVAHHTVDLSAKYGGLLQRVHVRLGDSVASKQKIATLDAKSVQHELARARAVLVAARAGSRKASIQLQDARDRYNRRVSAAGTFSKEVLSTARSKTQLARVRRSEALAGVAQGEALISNLNEKLHSAEIRAPFAGKVAAIYQQPGTNVGAGQPIVRLITAHDMWVRFAIPKQNLSRVKAHATITARLKSVGASLEGTIKHIAPEIDPASQMIFVEAQLVVPQKWSGRIPAGTMARVFVTDKK